MEFRFRRKIDANIDMTPMIDTLLQLFVAFLLSMSFAVSAVPLSLPKAAAGNTSPAEGIVLALDAQQRLFLNDTQVTLGELPGRLQAKMQETPGVKVVLRADRSLAYEKIVEVLVAIQKAKVNSLQLAFEERSP